MRHAIRNSQNLHDTHHKKQSESTGDTPYDTVRIYTRHAIRTVRIYTRHAIRNSQNLYMRHAIRKRQNLQYMRVRHAILLCTCSYTT